MQGLIDNLLDFAKGHLGEGIKLKLSNNNKALKKILLHVLNEIKIIDPNFEIQVKFELNEVVSCDHNRIGQLYSNLLGNAIKHGDAKKSIKTDVISENGEFSIRVLNSGDVIPEEKMISLFKPFFSTNSENNKSGLGLGLYISSEIAKAHGGNIKVKSQDDQIRFTFNMPTKKLGNNGASQNTGSEEKV